MIAVGIVKKYKVILSNVKDHYIVIVLNTAGDLSDTIFHIYCYINKVVYSHQTHIKSCYLLSISPSIITYLNNSFSVAWFGGCRLDFCLFICKTNLAIVAFQHIGTLVK